MTRLLCATLLTVPLALTACDRKTATTPPPATPSTAAIPPAHEAEAHGEEVELGSKKAGAWDCAAVIGRGWDRAAEAHVEVQLTGTGSPGAVRTWIGLADKTASMVAKLNPEGANHYHGHAEVAAPVAAEAQLWVEIDGAPAVGFDLSKARTQK